jgi:hypothetical protein
VLVDLHPSQDGEIDVSAANHRERLGAREERRAGKDRDRLLAGVDEVRVFLPFSGYGPTPSTPFSDWSTTSIPFGM